MTNLTINNAINGLSEGGTLAVSALQGVLADDTDPFGYALAVTSISFANQTANVAAGVATLQGAYGTLTMRADGSYSYLANNNISLPADGIVQDKFTFVAGDGYGNSGQATLTITVTQTGVQYVAAAAGSTVNIGNRPTVVDASLGNVTVNGGNANDVVIGGAGDKITLGSGNDTVLGGSNETISVGNGADTVLAGASDKITAGNGNDTVTAGNNSTVAAGNGNDVLSAGSSSSISAGNGTNTIASGPGSSITGGGPGMPTITTPVIGGTAREGETLTASASSNDPISYAWYSSADGFANPIGTGATYLVKEADEGFTIEVKATARNGAGASTSELSVATAPVLDAAPTVTVPTITGAAQEGQTLSALASSGQSDNPVSYAWYSSADNYANSIGTGANYQVQEGDEGSTIEVKATATNDNGATVSATSAATAAVTDNASLALSLAVLGNSGSPIQEGQTLVATASVSGDADDLGAPVAYQWQTSSDGGATWTNVSPTTSGQFAGGLSSFYQLGEADEGNIFRVQASFTDDTGQVVSATSASTVPVADVTPILSVPFSYTVDEFKVVTATQTFDDRFSNGPPPVGSAFGPKQNVFQTSAGGGGSTWTEGLNSLGQPAAIMSSTGAAFNGGNNSVQALLVTNNAPEGTGPGQSNGGLKENGTFTISGTFDLIAPQPGTNYGIALVNVPAPTAEEVQLQLQQFGGSTTVVLNQSDPVDGIFNPIASFTLSAQQMSGNNEIELDLAHATANSSTVIASFKLIDNGTVTFSDTFSPPTPAHIFNDSTAARAEIQGNDNRNVTILGIPQEGQTLTANTSTNDSDATINYQWQSSADGGQTWAPIAGAPNSASYVVQESDENHEIRVVASTSDPNNPQSATATSAPTSSVIDQTLVPTVMISPAAGSSGVPLDGGQSFNQFVGFGDSGLDSGYYLTHQISTSPLKQAQYNAAVTAGGGLPTTVGAKMNSQLLAADYGVTAIPDGMPGGTNYAVSGAPIIGSDPLTPSVQTQIQTYLADVNNVADPNALYLINAGGGDASLSPDQSPQGRINFMLQEAQTLANGLAQIHADGGRYFAINATAGQLGSTFDNALWSDLAALGVPFFVVDKHDFESSITPGSALAQQYGITNFLQPPAGPFTAVNPYDPANGGADINPLPSKIKASWALFATTTQPDAQSYLWADDQHLAAAGQQAVADFTYNALQNAVPVAGETLTATESLQGSAPERSITNKRYQWESSTDNGVTWTQIIGAAQPNYTVQESDEGALLRVHVTVTNDTGQTSDAYSAATPTVLDNPPTVTTPTISGTAQEGQELTASATAGESDDPVTYAWYSSADGYTNPIGAGAIYLVQQGDAGNNIEVKATASNDNGITTTATSLAVAVVPATDGPSFTGVTSGSDTESTANVSLGVNVGGDADDNITVSVTGLPTDLTNVSGGSYAIAPASTVINFDSVDTSGGAVGGTPVTNYLASYGITFSSQSGTPDIAPYLPGNPYPDPISSPNFFGASGPNSGFTYTLSFASPLNSLSFTVPGLGATSSMAAWSATAYSATGTQLGEVGDPSLSFPGSQNQTYTLTGPGIAYVQFSDNVENFAGNHLVFDNLTLNSAPTGTWTGTEAQFNALTFTTGEQGSYNLDITATNSTTTTTASESYTLTVNPAAEGPVLGGATSATVNAGGSVTLGVTDITADTDDTIGNVTITGLPTDLTNVNGGAYTGSTGTWTGTAAQFNALSFTAGETTGSFNLSIAAATTGAESGTTTGSFTLAINPATPTLTTLVDLSRGAQPVAGLFADANGDLLGTTELGGANGDGSVFEIVNHGTASAPSYASSPTTIVSFNLGDGSGPHASLIGDANGDLFGTTVVGGPNYGTIFEIMNDGTVSAPSYASTPTTLYGFGDPSNGANPSAGLIADANGNLFGTAAGGFDGTVFEVVNNGTVSAPSYASSLTILVHFNRSNGAIPEASLIADANGDLFGTTLAGGANDDNGTVFEIVNNGTASVPSYASSPTTLVSFNGSNGSQPQASLVADANGDLFGTTSYGGTNNGGTVFEIVNNGTVSTPSYASTPTTLVSFNGSNGELPMANLIADANGDLFGTTETGGANGDGTVFEIVNNGTVSAPVYASSPTTLVNFNGSNGEFPLAGLLVDVKGDLFGTTEAGGALNGGTVFEITNSGYVVPDPVTIANGGSFEIASASEDAITFAGNTGSLLLDQSQSFIGNISGFGGQDQIDLSDIAFGADTTLAYAANAGNTGGSLTVTDGTHTATLALLGQYMAASFAVSSDGHGGTTITDPVNLTPNQLAQPHA